MRDQCWLVEEFEGHWRRRCFTWIPAGAGMTKCGGGDDVAGGGIRRPRIGARGMISIAELTRWDRNDAARWWRAIPLRMPLRPSHFGRTRREDARLRLTFSRRLWGFAGQVQPIYGVHGGLQSVLNTDLYRLRGLPDDRLD